MSNKGGEYPECLPPGYMVNQKIEVRFQRFDRVRTNIRSDGFFPRWKSTARGRETSSFPGDSDAERIRPIFLKDLGQDIERRVEAVVKYVPLDINTYDFLFEMDEVVFKATCVRKSERYVVDCPVRVDFMEKSEFALSKGLFHNEIYTAWLWSVN